MSGTTAGVDASIPLQAGRGVPQVNPLQQIGQYAQTANALNALKLFPGVQQLQQQEIQNNQMALTNRRIQSAYGYLAPLLAQPQITHDQFTSAMAGLENLGIPTHDILNDVLKNAPSGDGPAFTANARAAIASRMQNAPTAALAAVTPQMGPAIDVGPAIQPTVVAPAGSMMPGAISAAGGSYTKGLGPTYVQTGAGNVPTNAGQPTGGMIPNAPSPGEQNQLVPVWNPKKQAYDYAPRAQVAPMVNGVGQPIGPLGNGRLPAALQGPNAPPPQAAEAKPGPAQESAMTSTGAQSTQAFQNISNQGVQARGQNSILGTMLADAQQFTTGPQAVNNFKAWLVRNGAALGTSFGIPPEKVAANESFDKLANQIADAQGAGSDARLAVIQHANPGSQLSPAGADQIIRQLQGNADYLIARQKLAADYPDQTNVRTFEADIGTHLDPRVFQFMRMTPQQRSDYAKALNKSSPSDFKDLQEKYQWAVQHGVIGGG